MERMVVFDSDTDGERGRKRFEMLLTAIHHAGDKSEPRNRETIRKEARLLDALDGVSEPDEDRAMPVCANCGSVLSDTLAGHSGTRDQRKLKAGRHELVLRAEDYKLLEKYVETTPWLPSSSRAAVDTLDWFGAAEKRD